MKVWGYTATGTKIHAFKDGAALCRSSIKPAAQQFMTRDEAFGYAASQWGVTTCANCKVKFLAAEVAEVAPVETPAETPAEVAPVVEAPVVEATEVAGTYYPAAAGEQRPADARNLVLQREIISATVYADGTWVLFAGAHAVDCGYLKGLEGPLMKFFTGRALAWSAKIDAAMAEEAERRAEREAAHRAEADVRQQSLEEIITMVDALGGEYHAEMVSVASVDPLTVPARSLVAILKDLPLYRGRAEVVDRDGGWFVELSSPGGIHARYHFTGH